MSIDHEYVDEQLDLWARQVFEEASHVGEVDRVDSIPDKEHDQVIFRLQLKHGTERNPFLLHFRGIGIGDAIYFKRTVHALV